MKRIVLLLTIFKGTPALILRVEASKMEKGGNLLARENAPLSSAVSFIPTKKAEKDT